MKVTFVMGGPFDLSGGARVIEIQARHLLERGHEVTVVTRPYPAPSLRRQVRSLLRGNGWIRDVPGRSHFTDSPVPHRTIDRHRPIVAADLPDADVVVATWWETANWVANLPPEKGGKAFYLQGYESFSEDTKAAVEEAWQLPLHKITISRWLVELATDLGDDDVDLVPNSVDTTQFHAPPRHKQSVPTIGFLAHTLPLKGIIYSVDAIGRLLDRFSQLRLFTFGEHVFDNPFPDRVDHLHYRHPAQDRIRDIYAQCDVWLCGSTMEGFHLPHLEAMACRCPVVSTMVGGPLDNVRDGINGYLAPVRDAEKLSEGLTAVLELSDDQWRAMSDAAYRTATSYTWTDASILFEQGLERAIAKRPRS